MAAMEVAFPIAGGFPTAPSSPAASASNATAQYYYYSSAPTSPRTAVYYQWDTGADASFDFGVGFSGPMNRSEHAPILATADELFEGGRIRPLNSDWRLCDSALPLQAAPSRRSRGARSLSPMRGGADNEMRPSSPPSSMRGCGGGGGGSKKWRLMDLLLFRSASEGRATGRESKDPLLKYTMFGSSSSSSSPANARNGGEGNATRRERATSAAASSYYPASRVEETRRRTTPLPFHRNSLFGYLRSNAAIHSISRKLGSGVSLRRGGGGRSAF